MKHDQDNAQKAKYILIIIFVLISLSLFLNDLISFINLKQLVWEPPTIVPVLKPVGDDFRVGWYRPAISILRGQNPYLSGDDYPPLVTVMALPFAATLPETPAYLVQVAILVILNLATLYLSVKISIETFLKGALSTEMLVVSTSLFFLVLIMHFSSYGFLFSIERGNCDAYAIFFSVLGLWLLVMMPDKMLLQILCISIATHIKIYPAVLFLLIFWKHRWKFLLPTIGINTAFALILGIDNFKLFIQSLFAYSNELYAWVGNHSSLSFLFYLRTYLGNQSTNLPLAAYFIIFLTPIAIWIASILLLIRGGYSETKAVWGLMISVPLMNVLPTISHDYKLIILTVPLIMALLILSKNYIFERSLISLGLIIAILVTFIFITRSYVLLTPPFQNKWPFIVLFQLLLFLSLVNFKPRNEQKMISEYLAPG